MNYNPLDEEPKIRFDGSDVFVLIVSVLAVLYFVAQIVSAAL